MTLDLGLAIDPAQAPALAQALTAHGRSRIPGALAPATAQALYAELASSGEWTRTFRQGPTERVLSAHDLATMGEVPWRALEQFAHAGPEDGFRFLHDAIRIPPEAEARHARGMLLERVWEALNAEPSLELFRTVAGDREITRLYIDATRYLPGHFLTRHNDGRKFGQRVLAFVLNLSPRWRADWGGLLQFHDDAGDIERASTPVFNTLSLFTIPRWHSVSMVAPFAPIPRISLAGWLYRD